MNKMQTCVSLACLSLSGAAAAADSAYGVHGELVLWKEADQTLEQVATPTRAERIFAVSEERIFFGAQPTRTLPRTDEWAGMQLWSVRRDGTDPVVLEARPIVLRASWSEAAQQVLYWTADMDLFTCSQEGGDSERIAERAASPAFSPDGERVAYAGLPSSWVPGSLFEHANLRVLDRVSGQTQELTQDYDDAEPIWSPDGTQLYFVSGRTQLASLWSYAFADGTLRQVTNLGMTRVGPDFVPPPADNSQASWSEDGQTLLYGGFDHAQGAVQLVTIQQGGQVQARSLPLGFFPSWQADGSLLAVQERSGGIELTTWSVEGERLGSPARLSGRLDRPRLMTPAQEERSTEVSCRQDPTLAPDADPRFRLPLASNPGYSAYYDNNSSTSLKDWKCGTATYDGHTGTDFKATLGTTVYAGATGTMATRSDGCADVGYIGSTCGGGYGNYIKLSHGNSWYTYYAHMKNGTPTTATSVNCGVKVGLSASSGNSSGYHLHFEVRKYSYPYNDPFKGSCSGSTSYWVNQNNGYPTTTCQ